jgi:hypothetical protein
VQDRGLGIDVVSDSGAQQHVGGAGNTHERIGKQATGQGFSAGDFRIVRLANLEDAGRETVAQFPHWNIRHFRFGATNVLYRYTAPE